MNKKQILLLIPTPFYSPLSMNNFTRVKAIISLGHSVDILTYPHGEDLEEENLNIIRFPRKKIFKEFQIGEYKKIFIYTLLMFCKAIFMKKKKYDVIIAFGTIDFIFWILKPFIKPKLVATIYTHLEDELIKWNITKNTLIYRLFSFIEYFTASKYDKVILGNDRLVEKFVNRGLKISKIKVIKQTSLFYRKTKTNKKHGKYFTLAYTGSFVEVQNIDLIYKTAKLLRNQNIQFLLIGANKNDLIKEEKKIINYKINDIVSLVPKLNHEKMYDFISKADVLISPRVFGEDTPIKIFDYLYCGKCILATDEPIHKNLLNSEIAFLAKSDPESFAQSILYLRDNPDLVIEFGRKAKEYFEENFSLEKMRHKYAELFNELDKKNI